MKEAWMRISKISVARSKTTRKTLFSSTLFTGSATGSRYRGMLKSLRTKFLILLLGVVALSLSGTFLLRELMLSDFNAFLEGNAEDKVYWILAHLEGSYEHSPGWKEDAQAEDALWALNLGFEMTLRDKDGKMIMDTRKAIESASPMTRRRLIALSQYRSAATPGEFVPYPLFLRGSQIGTLELRELRHAKEAVFIRRSDLFLLLSVLIIGGLATLLSILFSTRLTHPIKELASAASAIRGGDYTRQVAVTRRDEVGDLSEAFNRMATALETQESLRKKLIADVAHELRTPLGVIRGELEAMMDGLMPNDPEHLQSLYDETGRLKTMVDGIEELNRAEASTLSLLRTKIKAESFLSHIVERFAGLFREKGVDLQLECESATEMFADPDRLSQIVINLLSNALKATGQGGRVLVSAAGIDGEVGITVKDNGSGIRAKICPIFLKDSIVGPEAVSASVSLLSKNWPRPNGGEWRLRACTEKVHRSPCICPRQTFTILHNLFAAFSHSCLILGDRRIPWREQKGMEQHAYGISRQSSPRIGPGLSPY